MAASYAHMAALWRVKERTQICSLFFLQNTFPFLNAFSLYRQKFEFGNMLIVAGFNTRIKHHHFSPFIHGICELSAHFIRADRRLDRRPCHNQLLSNLKQLPPPPAPKQGPFHTLCRNKTRRANKITLKKKLQLQLHSSLTRALE